jgi:phospholipid/cholesterol/gamma-HCH transport system substrate-binding protein
VSNLNVTTSEINRILPEMNKQNPHLGQDLAHVTQNLSIMMGALGPTMKQIEGELPGASMRFLEALNETVVLLKAMEKNYFLKGSVQEVREEETARAPASSKNKK